QCESNKERQVTQPRTAPSSNESHAPQQQLAERGSKTKEKKRECSSPVHRSLHSHSHCYCCSLSSGHHRHATLTPTRAPPAQASGSSGPPTTGSPSCAPAAPQHPPPPPSVQQLHVLHVPHNRRHAPAAQHTQRHNVVPPLLHNHERNAQRVLAHVLHALQPHVDQVGRHALHLVVLLLLGADPSSLSIHGLVLQEAAERFHFCGKTQMCGNNGHPHTSPLPPLSHTKGRCHGEEKPAAQRMHKGTCNSNAIHVTPQDSVMRTAHTRRQRKERADTSTYRTAIYFSPHG
ncbi:hypothetical protein TcCL_ESM06198, partial [Trypanosoma cruzi]